jgi:hypothetical protein
MTKLTFNPLDYADFTLSLSPSLLSTAPMRCSILSSISRLDFLCYCHRWLSQENGQVLLNGTLIPGDSLHSGEVRSPLPGEFRLQSDAAIAR